MQTKSFHVLAVALLLAGCGKSGSSGDASSGDAGPTPATVFKSGYARGKIVRPDGKPINISGIKYDLAISGISGAAQNVTYTPKPNADGTWSTKLVGGIYHAPRCSVMIPFAGASYHYNLTPTADLGDSDAEKGIAADFIWKMSGPCNNDGQAPDPGNATHWIGGSCPLIWERYYEVNGKPIANLPDDGAILRFTATAKGKAIDGSTPMPIVWDRRFDSILSSIRPSGLNDLPPTEGGWSITAKQILPDKTEKPLVLCISTESKFAQTVDISLTPNRIAMLSNAAEGPMLRVMPMH